SFQSHIVEGSATFEYNIMRFEGGLERYSFTPYVLGGVGVFHFNPQTIYNNVLVDLRPLHTEGQGFPGTGVKVYSLIQPELIAGVGIRYSVSRTVILGFEYRQCWTP